MLRILLLISVLFGSTALAQTRESVSLDKPTARLVDEVGRWTMGDKRARLDALLTELAANPKTKGLIVIYGQQQMIAAREKEIREWIAFRNFPPPQIEIIAGGYRNELKNQFWVVPAGAAQPTLEPTAKIFAETISSNEKFLSETVKRFVAELDENKPSAGYIINYGTDAQIARREKIIRDAINFRRFEPLELTIVRGGKDGKSKTVFWIVPPGAEIPQP